MKHYTRLQTGLKRMEKKFRDQSTTRKKLVQFAQSADVLTIEADGEPARSTRLKAVDGEGT